jgi:Uma2 family endonuclease
VSAELTEAFPPPGGWTTDDLDALPEDGRRRELIDGVLIMPPSPTSDHQYSAARLVVALDEICPPEWAVTQAVEVRVTKRRSFIPDVLVINAEAADRNPSKVLPEEVALAVEIVSPGSVTLDRVTKPALYAQAGIPLFWRIETEHGIEVHTHRLDPTGEVYVETGRHTEAIQVDEPWPINLPVMRFAPRRRA